MTIFWHIDGRGCFSNLSPDSDLTDKASPDDHQTAKICLSPGVGNPALWKASNKAGLPPLICGLVNADDQA